MFICLHRVMSSTMQTRVISYVLIKSLFLILCVELAVSDWSPHADAQIVRRVIKDCLNNDAKYSCLADRAAKAMEKAINWDIPIFDGITYKRNEEKLENVTAYNGIKRLTSVVSSFLESHTLTLDLTQEEGRELKDELADPKLGKRNRIGKRQRKYLQYAMFVLLGIFGLSAPVILKTLALIAGKALIASKIALIMLGSVALKKIFQADNEPSVKVHTHTIPIHDDHDYDRYLDSSAYNFVKTL